MPLVQILPWCRIERPLEVGEIGLVPHERGQTIEGTDAAAVKDIERILGIYRGLDGKPVPKLVLIRYSGKLVVGDLSEEEIEIVRDLVELACFAGLARREFFLPMAYCNTDCFVYYGHKFTPGATHTCIVSKRRDGRTWDMRPLDKTVFSMPPNVGGISRVDFDEPLLNALLAHRKTNPKEWDRWQNAISCYNQANSDNEAYRYQSEWVLMCGAFERLLNAGSTAEDVASKFAEALVPSAPLLIERVTTRKSEKWRDPKSPLRYEWMREFYRLRGDFAHGRLDTRQPMAWQPIEHLFLAAVAFPLTAKSLLFKKGLYIEPPEPTSNEKIKQTLKPGGGWSSYENFETVRDGFESLAAHQDFMSEPKDQKNSMDTVWARVMDDAVHAKLVEKLAKAIEAAPDQPS